MGGKERTLGDRVAPVSPVAENSGAVPQLGSVKVADWANASPKRPLQRVQNQRGASDQQRISVYAAYQDSGSQGARGPRAAPRLPLIKASLQEKQEASLFDDGTVMKDPRENTAADWGRRHHLRAQEEARVHQSRNMGDLQTIHTDEPFNFKGARKQGSQAHRSGYRYGDETSVITKHKSHGGERRTCSPVTLKTTAISKKELARQYQEGQASYLRWQDGVMGAAHQADARSANFLHDNQSNIGMPEPSKRAGNNMHAYSEYYSNAKQWQAWQQPFGSEKQLIDEPQQYDGFSTFHLNEWRDFMGQDEKTLATAGDEPTLAIEDPEEPPIQNQQHRRPQSKTPLQDRRIKAMDQSQMAPEFPVALLKVQMAGASSATRPKKIKKDYSQQHLQLRRIQKRVEEQNQYGGFYKRPVKSVSALAYYETKSGAAYRQYNHYHPQNSQLVLSEATLEASGSLVIPRINTRSKATLRALHYEGPQPNSASPSHNNYHLMRQTSHEENFQKHGASAELNNKNHSIKNLYHSSKMIGDLSPGVTATQTLSNTLAHNTPVRGLLRAVQQYSRKGSKKLAFVPRFSLKDQSLPFEKVYDDLMGHSFYQNSKLSDRKDGSLCGTSGLRGAEPNQKERRDLKGRLGEQRAENGLWVVQPYQRPKSPVNHQVVREHSLQAGSKPHVKKYQKALEHRESMIQSSIEDQMEKFANFEDQTGTALKVEPLNQKSFRSPETRARAGQESTKQMQNDQGAKGNNQGNGTKELAKACLPEAVAQKKADKKMMVSKHQFSHSTEDQEGYRPHRHLRGSPRQPLDKAELSPQVDATDSLKPIDEIDFELRADIEGGCSQCRAGTCFKQGGNYVKDDPKMFEHVVRVRATFKKQQEQLKGAQGDHAMQDRTDRRKTSQKRGSDNPDPEHIRFAKWQKEMWARVRQAELHRLFLARPKYMEIYDGAKDTHLANYRDELGAKAGHEQDVKESLWKPEQDLAEVRSSIRYLYHQKEIGNDEFIESLLTVQEAKDRQDAYFEGVKELSFITKQKSTYEQLNDGEIKVDLANELEGEKKVVEELMNIRNRANYLQKQIKQINTNRLDEADEGGSKREAGIAFAKECQRQKGLAKLVCVTCPEAHVDNNYVLINQSLHPSQTESLCSIFKDFKFRIKQLYFYNNGLSGSAYSDILGSLNSLQRKELESIVYGGDNEFTAQSYKTLEELYLRKRPPYELKELKLIGTQVRDPGLMCSLLSGLNNDMRLQSLSLAQVNLEPTSINMLINVLEMKATCLRELDISWNKIPTRQMSKILATLKGNYYLTRLNIAFNPVSKTDPLKELGTFLKQNESLQHVDLSGVLQTSAQVRRVVKKAKRAPALLALHLNNTPCLHIDSNLRSYIDTKLGVGGGPGVSSLRQTMPQQSGRSARKSRLAAEAIHCGWKQKYELVQRAKMQQRESQYFKHLTIEHPEPAGTAKNFIMQRTIAHRELEGNGQWLIGTDCYVCSRWQYTLAVAPYDPQARLTGTFETLHHGPCTSAKPLDIREFARRLVEVTGVEEKDRAHYVALLPAACRAELRSDPELMAELQQRLAARDPTLYQEHNIWLTAITERLPTKSYQSLPQWPRTFNFQEHCAAQGDGVDPKLCIFADYVKPGQAVERYMLAAAVESLSSRVHQPHEELFVAETRKGELPIFQSTNAAEGQGALAFDKAGSVFKAWTKDNPTILRQALQYDLGYWKAARVVRDPEDFRQCTLLIQRHFEQLKHIFVNLISSDNYPHIGWLEFVTFCGAVDILDETIPRATVDLMFVATKTRDKDKAKPSGPAKGNGNTLFRHEFLEIMIRISNAKYRETGRASTFSEALSMMLESVVAKYETRPWQEFRDAELWTVATDRVLKANAEPLRKVYDRLFPKYGSSTGLKNCLELLTRTLGLQLSEKEARFCFGMSKMTVKDEVGNHSEYDRLRHPEYLEFLGRAAHAKFVLEPARLSTKLEWLLDLILPAYGLRRKPTPAERMESDSSDDSALGGAVWADDDLLASLDSSALLFHSS